MKIIYVHCGEETNISDPRSCKHYWTSNWNKTCKKFRPVRDLNPWPLQYRCSTLPTELTSQLGADHYVRPELHLCSRIDFQTNAQEAQAQHAFNALTIAPNGEGLTISNASELTYLTLPLGVVQFCISLVGLQTELDSTQSYHHY